MSFAVPLALAWLAWAIPIVVFYILKVRLRQAPVSTTIFWRQIYDEKRPRSLWQHLRHLLSLLAQLLLLLLLVFALAEPFFTSEILQARRIVLVVDNSASMKATDVKPSRLEAAKAAGRDVISGLRFRDEMAIIAAGAQPRVVCGLSGHERTLRDSLAGIEPSDGPTQVAAAVELGRRLLADAKHGKVIVLSDGCFPESEKYATSETTEDDANNVELRTVGTRVGNVGLTNFQVRRSLSDPIGYEILSTVTNASDEEVKCRVEIDLNDNPVDVIPLTLTPGQTWSKTIEKTSVDGGRLIARVKHDDALPTDNSAVAILPKREMQHVVLVSEGNVFLQQALKANALVDLKVVNAIPEKYEAGTLYVFHRLTPEKLSSTAAMFIDPISGAGAWQVGEALENPIVTKQDTDSPLMRHVRLDNVLLPEAHKITPPPGAHALATAISGDPLFFSFEPEGRKTLVLTVNLDKGDLTFRTAFPIMVTNALGWFAGQSGDLRESLASGAVTEVDLPAATAAMPAASFALQSPAGQKKPLPPGVAKATIGPLDEVGVWQVVRAADETADAKKKKSAKEAGNAEPPVLELACNLSNNHETDLRVPEPLLKADVASLASTGWFTRPIWFYLIALATLFAAVEWYLYQRRWIS
jgi:hypothetical protein